MERLWILKKCSIRSGQLFSAKRMSRFADFFKMNVEIRNPTPTPFGVDSFIQSECRNLQETDAASAASASPAASAYSAASASVTSSGVRRQPLSCGGDAPQAALMGCGDNAGGCIGRSDDLSNPTVDRKYNLQLAPRDYFDLGRVLHLLSNRKPEIFLCSKNWSAVVVWKVVFERSF